MIKQQSDIKSNLSHFPTDRRVRVYKAMQPAGSQRGSRFHHDTDNPLAGNPLAGAASDGRFIDRSKEHELEEINDARRSPPAPIVNVGSDSGSDSGDGKKPRIREIPNRPYDEYVVKDDPRFTRRSVSDFESMERSTGVDSIRRKHQESDNTQIDDDLDTRRRSSERQD